MFSETFKLLSLSAQIAQKQPEAIALLTDVYNRLFNETIQQGCGNCYQKAFFRIQKYVYLQQNNLTNKNMELTNRKYLLKPGRSLQTTFGGDTLTNDNLTDDAAVKLIKAYPSLLQHFDRYPVEHENEVPVENELPVEGYELPVAEDLPVEKQ